MSQIVVLPQQQRTTGMEQFVNSANPMIQQAFAAYLQRQLYNSQLQQQQAMADQQREQDRLNTQKTLEQFGAYTKTPEMGQFMQPNETYPQGMQLPIPGKFNETYDTTKIPEGMEIGSDGRITFKRPTPMFGGWPGMGGQGTTGGEIGGGIKLPPTTTEEAKQQITASGENVADYKFDPVYSTSKGYKVQTGISPIFDPKLQETRLKNEEQVQFIKDSAQDSLDTITEIKAGINQFGATGPIPTLNPWDYPRKKWEANVNKLLSGKVVELITKMKSASKTGATGFGQLSEREGQLLREASTALNRGLAPKDAEALLTKMETILQKVVGENVSPQSDGGLTDEQAFQEYMKMKTGGL